MEKLVKEIILIAKLDASDIDQPFEQINLEQILVPCVKKILPVANEKKIEIQNNVEDIQICVNKRLFEKALSNVILNAVQYSPAGEKVIIKLEKKMSTSNQYRCTYREHGGYFSTVFSSGKIEK